MSKQLSLFDAHMPRNTSSKSEPTYWKLCVDGAARNNPGPAGAGVCIFKNDVAHKKTGAYLGTKTNNQAEYYALLLGLFYVRSLVQPGDMVLIISDSQLLIRQLQGVYRVKESHLKPLYACAQALLDPLNRSLAHVLREENTQADEQANKAIDKKTKLPVQFLTMLDEYGISHI